MYKILITDRPARRRGTLDGVGGSHQTAAHRYPGVFDIRTGRVRARPSRPRAKDKRFYPTCETDMTLLGEFSHKTFGLRVTTYH